MTELYLSGALALIGLFALRAPHENLRTVFALAIMWPLSILLIIVFILMSMTNWNIDSAMNTKMFGFRRPTNPNAKGFAVTIFYVELQFYKTLKI
jgi:glucan phosphoethanolaminetransferase (alkaline phosphatase superfamily)